MLGEQRHAAWPGEVGACLVVTRPFIAVEAVLRAGIDMDLDLGTFGPDGLDIAERNACVLLAEMSWVGTFGWSSAKRTTAPP
jgi:hypothetical protein